MTLAHQRLLTATTMLLLAPQVEAQSQAIEYGSATDLTGVTSIFVYTGADLEVRDNIWRNISKELPYLRLASSEGEAQVLLLFGGSATTSYGGTVTNHSGATSTTCQGQADSYGGTTTGSANCDATGSGTSFSLPLYRTIVQGQGWVAVIPGPGRVRILLSYQDTRHNIFEHRPSTNFARAFVKAYKEANPTPPAPGEGPPRSGASEQPVMSQAQAQQVLFVQRARGVLDHTVDSLGLYGKLAERLYSESAPTMTTLYTANPAASLAEIQEALWPKADEVVRVRDRFLRRSTDVFQRKMISAPKDSLARSAMLHEASDSVHALLSRDPDASDRAIDSVISPAFRAHQ